MDKISKKLGVNSIIFDIKKVEGIILTTVTILGQQKAEEIF